jgi:hypothetical protein
MIHKSYQRSVFVTLTTLVTSLIFISQNHEKISKFFDDQMPREQDVLELRRQMLQEEMKRNEERFNFFLIKEKKNG